MISLPRERLRAIVPGPIEWGRAPLQSGLGRCPWRIAVASMLCNRTKRTAAEPVLKALFAWWPTAADLARALQPEVESLLRPLGLQRVRSRRLIRFSSLYTADGWQDLRDLPGVGKYVADAVGLCCFGCTELESMDGAMTSYAGAVSLKQALERLLPVSKFVGGDSEALATVRLNSRTDDAAG